ncbi:MAG: lactoylglutathione lyase [Chloroflexota bacterium]|jgi:catechol 2,3-dioxygenase-like lactoylglutathione lyase family enzyme|nr:lactoylglutathione lyase [Chloroflexota bacterium]
MAKIRHIAYRAQDPEAMVKFFVDAFEMTVAERRPNGAIDLSDGTMNITILPMNRPSLTGRPVTPGIEHMGFTAEDNDAAKRRILAAGGTETNTINFDGAHFEVKYEGPEGIIVDLGHWTGTAPVAEAEPAGTTAR